MQEIPPATVQRARVFVDSRAALSEAGDIIQPLEAGLISAGHVLGEIGEVAGGNTWWGLEYADQLARFNIRTHRFDRFVRLRGGHGPHWLTYVPADHAVWIAFAYSNNLARFDLRTRLLQLSIQLLLVLLRSDAGPLDLFLRLLLLT